MPEPASILLTAKEAIFAFAALFGINFAGWRMYGKVKLKQIEDHEQRIKEIEKNHISRAFLNDLGVQVNLKLDRATDRIDRLYELMTKEK